MSAPDILARYLDARGEADRPLEFWWRDDDLETPSPELSRCLEALGAYDIPAAFAAVPSGLTEAAVRGLEGSGSVLFVHGWSHTNHAPTGEKKAEFGADRPLADRLADVARGWDRLRMLGGGRATACFVPPWNRIGTDLLAHLHEAGITAVSAFASPKHPAPSASVPRLDTHIDLIDWRGTGGPIPASTLVDRLLTQDGVDGPVGILSHHRVTDAGAWDAWRPVLAQLSRHPAVRWLSPGEALARVGVQLAERRNG